MGGERSSALVCGQQASDVAGFVFIALFSVTLDLSAGGEKIKSREGDRGTQSFKMLSNKLCQTYQSREAPAATTQPTCIEFCSSYVIKCRKKLTETNETRDESR